MANGLPLVTNKEEWFIRIKPVLTTIYTSSSVGIEVSIKSGFVKGFVYIDGKEPKTSSTDLSKLSSLENELISKLTIVFNNLRKNYIEHGIVYIESKVNKNEIKKILIRGFNNKVGRSNSKLLVSEEINI